MFLKRVIKYFYYHFVSKNKVAIHFISNTDFVSKFGKNCSLKKNSRVSNSTVGNSVTISENAKIKKCELGNQVTIYGDVVVVYSTIGDFSYVSKNTNIHLATVGKFCSIGQDALIGLGLHPTNFLSTSPVFYSANNQHQFNPFYTPQNFEEYKKINIGNDVWIGARAIILDGVSIGDGAIIAAGAVVSKDVEPYAIVGGIPAKFIKYRFAEEERKKLLELKWWNWEIDKIEHSKDLFSEALNLEHINLY